MSETSIETKLLGLDGTIERYVLNNGQRYRRMRRPRRFLQGDPQCCFGNALRAISVGDRDGVCDYVEGYILLKGELIHHAWVGVGDEAIEVTLPSHAEAEYFGVPFDPTTVNYTTPVLWDIRRLINKG